MMDNPTQSAVGNADTAVVKHQDTLKFCCDCRYFSYDKNCLHPGNREENLIYGPRYRSAKSCRESTILCGRDATKWEAITWRDHIQLFLVLFVLAGLATTCSLLPR